MSQTPTARTSQTHPLRIATIRIGASGGAIGITFAPGKHQTQAMTGTWARDLDIDLHMIKQWGASDLITLLEPHELDELGIPGLPEKAAQLGLAWHGFPISDGQAPDDRFLRPWLTAGPLLANKILHGYRVLVHCKGGLGRAGTVACLLLLATGAAADADAAMQQVRDVRPGAIETAAQESFLRREFERRRP